MNSDWQPLWIGPSAHRMYAAFHPADGPSTIGVVIVPPLLHELSRCRRFMTEMAAEFARQGIPCLRFDFHGTGDSSGTGDDTDFSTLRRDLDIAVSALRQRAPVSRVCLVAWRGSALVLPGWVSEGGDASPLVLWEPIIDGADWLRKLSNVDARERLARPPSRLGVKQVDNPGDGQLMGFSAPLGLREDLAEARLEDVFGSRLPVWAVLRAGQEGALAVLPSKTFVLPSTAPAFNDEAAMDSTFFLTPQVRDLVSHLGRSLDAAVPA